MTSIAASHSRRFDDVPDVEFSRHTDSVTL